MAGGSGKPSSGQTAQLVSLGTMLFACVAVGLGVGYFADRWLGTQPWLLLIGLGLGISGRRRELLPHHQGSERDGSI